MSTEVDQCQVLTISNQGQPSVVENGMPIWAVIALTLEGDTMTVAQLLEKSQTVKQGTGKKQM